MGVTLQQQLLQIQLISGDIIDTHHPPQYLTISWS